MKRKVTLPVKLGFKKSGSSSVWEIDPVNKWKIRERQFQIFIICIFLPENESVLFTRKLLSVTLKLWPPFKSCLLVRFLIAGAEGKLWIGNMFTESVACWICCGCCKNFDAVTFGESPLFWKEKKI